MSTMEKHEKEMQKYRRQSARIITGSETKKRVGIKALAKVWLVFCVVAFVVSYFIFAGIASFSMLDASLFNFMNWDDAGRGFFAVWLVFVFSWLGYIVS